VNKETSVPEWLLERYLLDELPRKRRRQLEKALAQNPGLQAKLEELRLEDRRILSAYPPEQVIPQILGRARLARKGAAVSRSRRLAWVAAPALAMAVFLLVILPPILQRRLGAPGDSPPGNYTGVKGGGQRPLPTPELRLYRRVADTDQLLHDGATARPGDLLQLAYAAGGETHGVILSIDGAGSISLHFPQHPDGDTTLRARGRVFLADAFELDAAPRFERFFLVTAREPLSAAAILEKARLLAADGSRAMTAKLDLPAGYGQHSLLLRK